MNLLELYTDGAINIRKDHHPGGWAYAFVYNRMMMCTEWEGVIETTSQRMELTAALQGLLAFLNRRHKELDGLQIEQLQVVSDSAYLVNCINQMWYIDWKYNNWTTSTTGEDVKNKDLWELIIGTKESIESTGIKVTFKKIKGHSGIMYNELVDKLAVKGKLSVS